MYYWLVEVDGHLGGSLKTMSCIVLHTLYSQSSPLAFIEPPVSINGRVRSSLAFLFLSDDGFDVPGVSLSANKPVE